jgi:uncharacterized repeat protein (TIGR01451 family)
MGSNSGAPAASRRRRWWVTAATFAACAIVSVLYVASSGAVLPPSTFEGNDGNLTCCDSTAAQNGPGTFDWENVPGRIRTDDVASGSSDNSFGQGTHEDDPNVTIVTGSIPPNKNDLTRSYVATQMVGGASFLYLAWERAINTGSANLDFELNQNATANWDASTTGALTINRTEGDLLVTYDFGGSGTPDIGVLTWLTAGHGHSDSDCDASGAKLPCWGNRVDASGSGFAEAAVNTDTISEPIAGGTLTAGLFGEASINLSSALLAAGFNPDTCEAFGSEFVKSRASGSSIDAELKDFIAPSPIHVSNCAVTSIATSLSASTAFVGDTVHDTATLSGQTAQAGGSVSYSVYTDNACTQGKVDAGTKTVTDGVVPKSNDIQFNSAGTFYWQAVYSGDNHNNGSTSACQSEVLTVGKHSPTVATTLSKTSGVIGDTVHDSATLTGASSDAGGTATYSVYTDDACTLGKQDAGTKPVTNGVVTDSNGIQFNSAGTFYWQAVYSGDSKNNGATSTCTSEQLAIAKNTPTITTSLSSSEVVVGASVHDSATLSGATANAGGSVTYTVYTDDVCSAGARDAGTKTVTAGAVPDSDALVFPSAGTFYWQASYSGDPNNNAAKSACKSETLVVDRPAISITKNPKGQAIDSGGTATFTITVTNTGTVGLTNVTVTDALAPGCAKAIGTLTPTQSVTYTCSVSGVTAAFTNLATATGHPPVGPNVTATDTAAVTVSAPAPAPTPTPAPTPAPPAPTIDLQITKTAAPASVTVGSQVTWTLTVKNNGPSNATGVTVADPIPAGFAFVSATSTQGTCTGGAMLNCQIGAMANGATVTITLVTTATAAGSVLNTATVVGNESETNTANNTSSASAVAKGPFVPPAAPVCTALGVTPKQLLAGRKSTLTLTVTQKGKAIPGIRVQIIGSTLRIVTTPSNSKGIVKRVVRPLKAGIVTFRPVAQKSCRNARVGVIGVFTPPVTG